MPLYLKPHSSSRSAQAMPLYLKPYSSSSSSSRNAQARLFT
jgi:hypothetical protein